MTTLSYKATCNVKDCATGAFVLSREKVPEGWASVIVFSPPPNNVMYLMCDSCVKATFTGSRK